MLESSEFKAFKIELEAALTSTETVWCGVCDAEAIDSCFKFPHPGFYPDGV